MNNWKNVKLGNILIESKVEAVDSNAEKRIRVLLGTRGVIKRPLTKETKGATKYFKRKTGQFIYGKQNLHKGAFGIIPNELDGFSSSSDLPAFDIDNSCLPEWIYYFLRQGDYYISLIDIAKGAATKRIQPKALFEIEIPLPDLATQRRIINYFISKEEKQKELFIEIQSQKQHLSNLKQSILQEAIQGKLTADWRKQNPNTVPASDLLERIKSEKDQLIKDKKIKKEKTLTPITEEEIPFELPEGWVWCRLQDVTTLITDGKHGNCVDEDNSGYYFLSAKDIQNGKLLYNNARQINYKEFQEVHNRTNLEPLDLCMVNTGGTVGKTAIVRDTVNTPKTTFQKSVAVVKPMKQYLNTSYLNFFIIVETPNLLKTSRGSAINNLLLGDMKKVCLPLPPIEEQKAIVEKVETLMQKCQVLEEEIKTVKPMLKCLCKQF